MAGQPSGFAAWQAAHGAGGVPSSPGFLAWKAAKAAGVQPPSRVAAPTGLRKPDPKAIAALGNTGSGGSKPPADPLSTIMDLLTRPLDAVTNMANNSIEKGTQVIHNMATGKNPMQGVDVVGSAVNMLPPALNPAFWSQDPKMHRTTSDVIEHGTDVIGKAVDPNYKDVQNNVNPWVKGVGGFVGDVVGDPLTFVPGAAVGTIAKKVIPAAFKAGGATKAAQDAMRAQELIKGTVTAADNTDKAVNAVAKATTDVAKPTKQSVVDSIVGRQMVDAGGPIAETGAAANVSKILAPDKARELLSQARLTPKAASLAEGLAAIKPETLTTEVAKAGAAARKTPLAFAQADIGTGQSWLTELNKHLEGLPKVSDAPKIKVNGKPVSLATVASDATNGNPAALKLLEQYHQKTYLPSFAKAKAIGKQVDPTGRLVDIAKPTVQTETTALDALQNFRRQVVDDTSLVSQRLGPDIIKHLHAMGNPAKFDATIQRLSGILEGTLDPTTLAKSNYTNPVRALMRELGIHPDSIPIGIRKPQAWKNTEKVPQTVRETQIAETLGKMAGPEVDYTTQLAEHAMGETVDKNLIRPRDPGQYAYLTNKGVPKTEALYGDGYANHVREANTYYQWDKVSAMLRKVSNDLGKQGLGAQGVATASRKASAIMPALRLAERYEEQHGVVHTIGVGADRIPISLSQILDVLDEGDGFQKMKWAFWNQGTSVPPTNLMDAVYQGLKTGDRAAVEEALSATVSRYMRSDGKAREIPNNLVKGGPLGRAKMDGPSLVKMLTDHVMANLGKIDRQVSFNTEALKSRVASETYDLSQKTLDHLQQTFQSTDGFGPQLQAIADTSSRITKEAEAIGATQKAVDATKAIVDHAVPATDVATATKAKKIVDTHVATSAGKITATSVDEAQRAATKYAQTGYEEYQKAFMPGGDVRDFGTKIDQRLGRGIMQKIVPIVSRKAGNALVHEDMVRSEVIFKGLVSQNSHRVAALAAKMDPRQFSDLLTAVQKGVAHPNPTLAALQPELRDIWAQMFGREGQNALIDNAFFRENSNIHHVNDLLDYYRTGQAFDMDAAVRAAKENGTTVIQELAAQPASWKIDDPAHFLNSAYTAFAAAQTHQTLAHEFMAMAKNMGAISNLPKAGYALVGNDSGKSIMAKYLPHDVYFDDTILRQMHVVDNLMQQSFEWGGGLREFIDKVYRPVQDAWKYGMTLINPSHHIRNAVGDASLTFYANGIKGKNSYKHAMQAMASHNGYDGWDAIKALQGFEQLPDSGKLVAQGKLGQLTADGLYTAAANRGNLPTFKQLESLEESGRGKLGNAWQSVTNTRAAQKIGGISEARDHYFRLAHFSQFVEQHINDTHQYKTMKELLDAASAHTRKWHPDGTDLTTVESNVFRLLIPFYSWQRKAIPLIAEAMLTNPARVTVFPKASYGIATAMGVNPDSLSNPFPTDQMFPSYLTGQIDGPITKVAGKYYGVNPGIAANDVLNTFVAGAPLNNVLGMVSPIVRTPFELATGHNVATGGKINDMSDYVDSNVPVLGPLSRITGQSASGSLVSLLTGNGLDPQYQVRKGNKQGAEAVPLANYLTGAGIVPMSQPNQINLAEIEKRNAAAKGGKNASATGF